MSLTFEKMMDRILGHVEHWRSVDEFAGLYEVSSHGNVRSLNRNTAKGLRVGRVIKPKTTQKGYLKVQLSVSGKAHWRFVHRLVATAFLGGSSKTVNHIDGNKLNNRLDNLEWATIKENVDHALKLGTHPWPRKAVVGVSDDGHGIFLRSVQDGAKHGFSPSKITKSAKHGVRHKNHLWSYYADL